MVDKSDDRVRAMFGEIAPKYDRVNHLLSCNVDRYWRWKTVRKVNPAGEQPILDVCAGTGDLAFAFHKKCRGRVPVIAADFCPEMLAIGEQKRDNLGIEESSLKFVEADTQQLPFESDRFQVVSVGFGLRNVSDTMQGLREMVRVCCPGGRVAILEFSMPRWQPFKAIYGWYFRNVLPRIGQWLARNDHSAYNYLPESVSEFPSGLEMVKLLKEAGLQEARCHAFTGGVASLYVGVK